MRSRIWNEYLQFSMIFPHFFLIVTSVRSLQQLDGESVSDVERADAIARFNQEELDSLRKIIDDQNSEIVVC